jgi:peptidoglycan/xylan/chitin deacetylase (PgdA/CDA1 family)
MRLKGVPSSVLRGPGKPTVALYFDDGPRPATQRTIDEPKSGRAAASFFLIGSCAQGQVKLVCEEDQGWAAGDHTWPTPTLSGAVTGRPVGSSSLRRCGELQ